MTKSNKGGIITSYQQMKRLHRSLHQKIKSISTQISTLPEGNFYCTHFKKYSKWFVSDGKISTYIPKKNRAYAQQLAKKKYLRLKQDDLERELHAVEQYLRDYNPEFNKAEQLFADPAYYELLMPEFQPLSEKLARWQNASYETNPYHPEHLIHRTASGRLVRSKSESIIDSFLTLNKIPFHYEEKLVLGKEIMYPDFTICHPATGDIIYWENFGLMDKPRYVNDMSKKLRLYSLHGIIPGVNLITTFETENAPLCSELVEKIIDYYFL